MLPGERRNRILELVKRNKSITVKTLCDTLEASEATIRRDLTMLEAEGKIERTHGGAMDNSPVPLEYEESFYQKENQYALQKRAIAAKAFEFLKDNDSIVLDAGTTTLELARLIGQSNLHIFVVTNSTTVSEAISNNDNAELYVVGGKVRLNTLATVGNIAIETMKRFNVNKAFIGCNGISMDTGLTTPDMEEAGVKQTMLKIAVERFVLVDHTKFKKVATCQIAPISMVDYIVTDKEIDKEIVDSYAQNDIQIVMN